VKCCRTNCGNWSQSIRFDCSHNFPTTKQRKLFNWGLLCSLASDQQAKLTLLKISALGVGDGALLEKTVETDLCRIGCSD
jgi:hypothetical protein